MEKVGPGRGARGRGAVLPLAAGIVVVALALRVGYVLATPGYLPVHDDRAYDYLARGIARSGAYPDVGGRPSAYRPPGYPYVLGAVYALTGPGHARITGGRLLAAGVGALTVGLIGMVARRLFGRTAALAAMAMAAVYPPFVAAGTSLLAEPQTMALELAGVLAVLRWRAAPAWRWVVAAGLIGGALTLTRSNTFVVVFALAAGVWTGRPRRVAPAGALFAAAAVVVLPWTLRNAVVMHSFIPVSDEEGGTLAGTYNPVSDHDRAQPAYWHLLNQIPTYQAATRAVAGGPEPQFQDRLLHLALTYAEDHPVYPAKVAFWNTVRLLDLNPLGQSRYTAGLSGITSPAVADSTVFGFWIVALLAGVGVLRGRVRKRVPGFVWLAVLALFVSITLVNGETPRLRLPIDPFLLVVAGGATVRSRPGEPLWTTAGQERSGWWRST